MNIAIVEDEKEAQDKLVSYIERFSNEKNVTCNTSVFANFILFLTNYKPVYDVVFLDIELPYLNGLEGAKKLREKDPDVPIIFVTNLAQYGVQGYKVSALDYLVKPYSYEALELALLDAVKEAESLEKESITIHSKDGDIRVSYSSIIYIEVQGHDLLYCLDTKTLIARGSMSKVQKALPSNLFFKVSSSFLINLAHVTNVKGDYVYLKDNKLKISRLRKKDFLEALHRFINGGKTL